MLGGEIAIRRHRIALAVDFDCFVDPLAVFRQRMQPRGGSSKFEAEKLRFNAAVFLASAGLGRRIIQLTPKDAFFFAGRSRGPGFLSSKGPCKATVVSATGKEATITLLSAGDFVGEESLAAMTGVRLATATAITACSTLKISRQEMIHVMHEEQNFSDSS